MSFKQLLYKVLIWRGLYLLSAFLLNILVARHYSAVGSSMIYYLINLYSFVLLIAGFSLESGMGFFLAKKEAGARGLAALSIGWTLAATLLSIGLLKIWFVFFDPDVDGGLWRMTALTFIPGQLLITFFMALFYSKESAALPNMILTGINIVLIVLIPTASLPPNVLTPSPATEPSGYLTLYFTGILLQGVIMAAVFLLKYGKERQHGLPDKALLKKLFRFSLVALVANIAFFLVYRVDYWWVKKYCTPEELGNYIQVSRLGQMILVLPGLLAGAVFPGTALGKGQHMPDLLARVSRIAVPLFLSLFGLAALSGRWFFPLLFGRSFDKMYVPFLVILPGIFFLSLLTLLSAWFGGIKRPGVNAACALAGLLVIITGDLLFIPRFGITAAAATSTAGYFTCLLWSLLAFRKESRIGLGSLWIIKKEDWQWLKKQILLKR